MIHAMPLKADRPTTRATVVGCAISTTSNYLKFTRAYKIKSPMSKNRATLLNSSRCFEAATLRISSVEHLIARLIALAAQPLPSVPRLRASTLFGRRPPAHADSLGAAGVQKPVQFRPSHPICSHTRPEGTRGSSVKAGSVTSPYMRRKFGFGQDDLGARSASCSIKARMAKVPEGAFADPDSATAGETARPCPH
jgi:hypothetical protein